MLPAIESKEVVLAAMLSVNFCLCFLFQIADRVFASGAADSGLIPG